MRPGAREFYDTFYPGDAWDRQWHPWHLQQWLHLHSELMRFATGMPDFCPADAMEAYHQGYPPGTVLGISTWYPPACRGHRAVPTASVARRTEVATLTPTIVGTQASVLDSVPVVAPPRPATFVLAIWNLAPKILKTTIEEKLNTLDLEILYVSMCPEVDGACFIVLEEEWSANALQLILDMEHAFLPVGDKPIRAVKLTTIESLQHLEDMPPGLRQETERRLERMGQDV